MLRFFTASTPISSAFFFCDVLIDGDRHWVSISRLMQSFELSLSDELFKALSSIEMRLDELSRVIILSEDCHSLPFKSDIDVTSLFSFASQSSSKSSFFATSGLYKALGVTPFREVPAMVSASANSPTSSSVYFNIILRRARTFA